MNNSGFVNFGTVQAYPTGGTGPTAYGPYLLLWF